MYNRVRGEDTENDIYELKDALRHTIDKSILFGTGVDQPLGIANSPTTITVERQPDMQENLYQMMERFTPGQRGTWLINDYENASRVYSGYSNLYDVRPDNVPTLFGFPIIFSNVQPPIDEPGGIILADLSKYVIADGGAPTTESVPIFRWRYDETAFKMIYQVDGKPAVLNTYNGTSPFVMLGGFETHDNVTGKTIVICMYCGEVWDQGQVKCYDGYRGCGNSLLEPGGKNIVCHYCGRIWPDKINSCWDGSDGCGGGLDARRY
jgi:hypothetical protein